VLVGSWQRDDNGPFAVITKMHRANSRRSRLRTSPGR
jgi:hypothetical protein